MIHWLIKYIDKGYINPFLGNYLVILGFLFYNVYFKVYCHDNIVFQKNIISSTIWTNAFSFVYPLIFNFKDVFKISWRDMLVNMTRGIGSFANFFLYWNYALKELNLAEVIFGESLTEIVTEFLIVFWNWKNKDYRQILGSIPLLILIVFKLRQNRIASDQSNKSSFNYKAIFWITLPRLMSGSADYFYASHSGNSNPMVDSIWMSGTILTITLAYYLYLNKFRNYYENFAKVNFQNVLVTLSKSESRISSNFLYKNFGVPFQLSMDKLGFFIYRIIINMTSVSAFYNSFLITWHSFARGYILDSVAHFIKFAINSLVNEKKILELLTFSTDSFFQSFLWLNLPILVMFAGVNIMLMLGNEMFQQFMSFVIRMMFWVSN